MLLKIRIDKSKLVNQKFHLNSNSWVEAICTDKNKQFKQILEKINSIIKDYDIIIHLAAIEDQKFLLKYPNKAFDINFNGKFLYIERIDKDCGWDNEYFIYLTMNTNIKKQTLFFFQEKMYDFDITNAYVSMNDKKILGYRYSDYFINKINNLKWN